MIEKSGTILLVVPPSISNIAYVFWWQVAGTVRTAYSPISTTLPSLFYLRTIHLTDLVLVVHIPLGGEDCGLVTAALCQARGLVPAVMALTTGLKVRGQPGHGVAPHCRGRVGMRPSGGDRGLGGGRMGDS